MTGGLMQLVAYGAQDIYLTGNPMITYFKVVYRRHTNFAMESIQQTFNGTADFGQRVTSLISRNGDLVNGLVLEATLPALPEGEEGGGAEDFEHRWIDNIGHYLIDRVSVEIGGQKIDEHFGDWLEIWSQLTIAAGQKAGYLRMIGQDPKDGLGQPTGLQNPGSAKGQAGGRKIYVPLQFWFCRNVGLALPLIALQYHEVKINMVFAAANTLYNQHDSTDAADTAALPAGLTDVSLWVDYIYLDTDERRRFAQVSHEYLIEQLQVSTDTSYSNAGNGNMSVISSINFNHPVKELIWVCKAQQIDGTTVLNQPNNYTTLAADTNTPPLKNIIPAITQIVRMDNGPTDETNVNHSHNYSATTGAASNSVAAHTHGVSGITSAATTTNTDELTTALNHSHGYRRLLGLTTTFDYGNYENEEGQHLRTFAPDLTQAKDTYENENFDDEAPEPPLTRKVTRRAVTLAEVTTAHNYTAPITSDGVQGVNPVVRATIQLNGHERFSPRDGTYFNLIQCKNHHTNIPDSPGINVYSFALKPEDHQPSGSCNFSRIDNARLCLTLAYPNSTATNRGTVTIYGVNYNVLRIMSGMGGLAYSN